MQKITIQKCLRVSREEYSPALPMQFHRVPRAPERGYAPLTSVPAYDPKNMIDPRGTDPARGTTLDQNIFGANWMHRRVAELIALADDDVVSWCDLVFGMTGIPMRTTQVSGTAAIMEVFNTEQSQLNHMNQFYHPFSTAVNDKAFDEALAAPPAPLTQPPLAPPSVGSVTQRIGATTEVTLAPAGTLRPAGIPPGAPVVRQGDQWVNPASGQPVDPNFVATHPTTDVHPVRPSASPGVAHGEVINTESTIRVTDPGGGAHFVRNIGNGDVVAARRLLSGQQMTDADLKIWNQVYNNGIGVTAPAPPRSLAPAAVMSARTRAFQSIDSFVRAQPNADLTWRALPEHLGIVFLTPDGKAAVEAATWLAHYQQYWDGHAVVAPKSTARERVSALDFMTHTLTRIPFATLTAYYLLMWRAMRSQSGKDTKGNVEMFRRYINEQIGNFIAIRKTHGFISIAGHYDPERKKKGAVLPPRDRERDRDPVAAAAHDAAVSVLPADARRRDIIEETASTYRLMRAMFD